TSPSHGAVGQRAIAALAFQEGDEVTRGRPYTKAPESIASNAASTLWNFRTRKASSGDSPPRYLLSPCSQERAASGVLNVSSRCCRKASNCSNFWRASYCG